MSKMYKVYNNKISSVEVIKKTATTVTYTSDWAGHAKPCTSHIKSATSIFTDSWDEAHAFLLKQAGSEIDSIKDKLDKAKVTYWNIENMKNPEATA